MLTRICGSCGRRVVQGQQCPCHADRHHAYDTEHRDKARAKFFSGENRLRAMGDGMTCCGIDGLEGFKGNPYNICMMLNGKAPDPTEIMQQPGTADCFKSLNQTAGVGRRLKNTSFAGMMQKDLAEKKAYYKKTFGFDE